MDFTQFAVTCGATWAQFVEVVRYLGFWFFTGIGFALGFITAIAWVILCCHWDEKRGDKIAELSNRNDGSGIVGYRWVSDGNGGYILQ